MPTEIGFRIVDFALQSPSPTLHFEFQGGEPTLNMTLIRSVYDYARLKTARTGKRLSFSLVSNLVDVDDSVLAFLRASKIAVCTTAELPGAGKAPLRVIADGRPPPDTFDERLARARRHGMRVPFLMVVARNNISELRRYIDKAVSEAQRSIFLSPVQKLGFAKAYWHEAGLTMAEFQAAWRDAMEYVFELWDRGVLIEERTFSLALDKLFSARDVRYMDFRNPNGMVLGNLAYDQNGDVFSCDEGRGNWQFKIGNVTRNTYEEVLSSEEATRLVSFSLREHAACQACAYKAWCGVSPVVSWGETGDLDPAPLTDPMCQRTLGVFDFMVELLRNRPHRVAQALMIRLMAAA